MPQQLEMRLAAAAAGDDDDGDDAVDVRRPRT